MENNCLRTGRNLLIYLLILRAIVVFIEAHPTVSCQNWLRTQMKSLGIFSVDLEETDQLLIIYCFRHIPTLQMSSLFLRHYTLCLTR